MKFLVYISLIGLLSVSCTTSKKTATPSNTEESQKVTQSDTVKISNPDLGYDIIIIEPGFNTWLTTQANPITYYNQRFLENKNIQLVTSWNSRALQPSRYSTNLYEMRINYDNGTDYGFEVNYKLYNYFIYFQNKYKQNLLGSRVPTK